MGTWNVGISGWGKAPQAAVNDGTNEQIHNENEINADYENQVMEAIS